MKKDTIDERTATIKAEEASNMKQKSGSSKEEERKGRRHTLPHLSYTGPSIFDGLGDELTGLEGLTFATMTHEVSRDLSLSPFSRIRNDLEQFVEEGERDLEERLLAPHSPKITFGRSQASMASSPLIGPPKSSDSTCRSVWVGNLEKEVEESELRHHFGSFGDIESVRIFDGFAFVRYEGGDAACRAIEVMNGQVIGRTVIKTGPGKEQILTRQPSLESLGSQTVWVGNLTGDLDERRLEQVFSAYGPIDHIKLVPGKHCAFVSFQQAEHAAQAIKHVDHIGQDPVKVGYARHSTTLQQTNPASLLRVHQSIGGSRRSSTGSVGLPNPSHIDTSLPGEEGTSKSMEALRNIFGTLELGSAAFESALFTPVPKPPRFGPLSDEEPAVAVADPAFYAQKIPDLPPPYFGPDLTPARIRDYRRHLESHSCKPAEFDLIAMEILPVTVSASTDPVGNVLVQKLIEKGSDELKTMIIAQLAPYFAAVGIHKNGTWVIQKLINWCHQPHQQEQIGQLLQPFLVALLQDQFGNYVVQCCLQFGQGRNQFIFDGLAAECLAIGTSRFGSRAMRSCLESPHAAPSQQKIVASSILKDAEVLLPDINGIIVIQWFLDSDIPNKHRALLPVLEAALPALLSLRFAANLVCKVLTQSSEPDVRDHLLSLIFNDAVLLQTLLLEPSSVQTVQRILAVRPALVEPARKVLDALLQSNRSAQLSHLLKLQSDLNDPRKLSAFLQDTTTSPAPTSSSTTSSQQPAIMTSKLKAHVHQQEAAKGGEYLVFGTSHQLHPGKP